MLLGAMGGSKNMPFRDLPIRRKLTLLVISATVMALVLACMGFAIFERSRFRAGAVTELTTLADMLGACLSNGDLGTGMLGGWQNRLGEVHFQSMKRRGIAPFAVDGLILLASGRYQAVQLQ
jgi:hypothetical protein